jgi:hypothetical protein
MSLTISARNRAVSILDRAHADMRRLIDECLAAESYEEVAAVAAIASRLVHARLDGDAPNSMPNRDRRTEGWTVPTAFGDGAEVISGARETRSEYPRFERDGERLVKIGWSKKDRQSYEHRAPYSAIVAVYEALRNTKGSFTMDQILPLKDSDGGDIPSYQSYMIVAWLRQRGVVERNGNDGYTIHRDRLSRDAANTMWQSLPIR